MDGVSNPSLSQLWWEEEKEGRRQSGGEPGKETLDPSSGWGGLGLPRQIRL